MQSCWYFRPQVCSDIQFTLCLSYACYEKIIYIFFKIKIKSSILEDRDDQEALSDNAFGKKLSGNLNKTVENTWLVKYARPIWVELQCDHNRSTASSFNDHHEIFKSLMDKIRILTLDFIQLLTNWSHNHEWDRWNWQSVMKIWMTSAPWTWVTTELNNRNELTT